MKITTIEASASLSEQRMIRLLVGVAAMAPVAASLALRTRIRGTSSGTLLVLVAVGTMIVFAAAEGLRVAGRRRLARNTSGPTVMAHGVFEELRVFLGLPEFDLAAHRRCGKALNGRRDILIELGAQPARFWLLSFANAKLLALDAPGSLDEIVIGVSGHRVVELTLLIEDRQLVLEGKDSAPS